MKIPEDKKVEHMQEKYKETEIGLIPEDWDLKIFSEIVDIIGGGTPKTRVPEYWDGNIPWLSVVDFNNDFRTVFTTEKMISELGLKNSSTKLLRKGDLIISARGTVGAIAQLGKDMAFNQSCYGLRANEDFSNDFIYYLLKFSLNILKQTTHGSTFDTITRNTFDLLKVPIPSKEEQLAITNILASIDDKIELNHEMNKTLEAIGQVIFRLWFVNFEFPTIERQPYKSNGGEMVDSKLGEIPKGWKVGKIYDICDVIYGAPFSSKLFNESGEGIPLVRIRDLKNYKTGFFTTEKHPKGTLINPGDIIAGMDAEFRPYFWLGKKSWMNQRICMFKTKYDYIHKFFVYQTVKVPLKFYENSKVGTTVIHLSKSDVDKFEIVIPPKNILIEFYDFIEPIFQKMILNSQETNNLTIIRDSLLPKLMSGKIRVNIPEEATAK